MKNEMKREGIINVQDWKRRNSLEGIVDREEYPLIENYKIFKLGKYNKERESAIDPKSGAKVRYVAPHELPSSANATVLGMYDPATHTIYIANNLSAHTERFVYHHEVAHALGIKDEWQADNYAAGIVGYNIRDSAGLRKAA